MSQVTDISVIIATRNRAKSLSRTLDSFQDAAIPGGVRAEILVVDNASNDDTPAVAREAKLKNVTAIPQEFMKNGWKFDENLPHGRS